MSGYVYRCYDSADQLIYVGHSCNPVALRLHTHRSAHRRGRGSEWVADLDRVEIDRYPTWEDANKAEVALIRTLRPRANKQDNPDHQNARRAAS